MKPLALLLFFVSFIHADFAMGQNNNYEFKRTIPSSGEFSNDFYKFSYSAPSKTYESIDWKEYRDLDEDRNAIMLTGLSRFDSYALSILYKGKASPETTPLQIAKMQHPSVAFEVFSQNSDCATVSPSKPFELSPKMASFLAYCLDKQSNAIYELNISWQSLLLDAKSLPTLIKESEACAASFALSEEFQCLDRIGRYADSYKLLLSSFKTSGK